MTENEKNELRREGFLASASWVRGQYGPPSEIEARTEAARRYPTIDVQQGPSGMWYRLVCKSSDSKKWTELYSWESADRAVDGKSFPRTIGILAGDETAVSELLTRHAARGAQ